MNPTKYLLVLLALSALSACANRDRSTGYSSQQTTSTSTGYSSTGYSK